jgi:hypothetical protein
MRDHDLDVAVGSSGLRRRDRNWRRVASATRALALATSAVLLIPRPATACGSIAIKALPILPLAGAQEVPTNVSLLAYSTHGRVTFELRERETGTILPVSVACAKEAGAEVCHGNPGPLRARTSYLWKASVDSSSVPASEREFTTGDGRDLVPPLESVPYPGSPLEIAVLEHVNTPGQPCGMPDRTRIRVSVPHLDEPVGLAVSGMGGYPHPFEDPTVFSPSTRSVELTLWDAPACLAVRLRDQAGNERHVSPWCPGEQPDARNAADPASSAGCTASGGRPDSFRLLWLAVLLPLMRLSRRKSRAPANCAPRPCPRSQ